MSRPGLEQRFKVWLAWGSFPIPLSHSSLKRLHSSYVRFLCSFGKAAQRCFEILLFIYEIAHLHSNLFVELISSGRKSWTMLVQVLLCYPARVLATIQYIQPQQQAGSPSETNNHHCHLSMWYFTLKWKIDMKGPVLTEAQIHIFQRLSEKMVHCRQWIA